MNLIRKGSLGILVALALGSIGTWQARAWWETETAPIESSVSAKTVVVTIPSGSSAQSIGDQLLQAGTYFNKGIIQLLEFILNINTFAIKPNRILKYLQ